MRPRVFPAEDPGDGWSAVDPPSCFNEAAGIPRGRPHGAFREHGRPLCFNEAAGIPRGRLPGNSRAGGHDAASMRPRVFPAEDTFDGRALDTPPDVLQ